jgi:hypothetical protein
MPFQIVTQSDDGQIAVFTDCLTTWATENYAEITGTYANSRTRAELQGHPQMQGFIGPFWGGTTETGGPILRYEDSAAYAANCI